MRFQLEDAVRILSATPAVLTALLRDLPEAWVRATEAPGTWSPYDVIGHLIHGEETDWMTRVQAILSDGEARPFEPFNREAQFRDAATRTLPERLDEFARLRARNLEALRELGLGDGDLDKTGRHPALGRVTMRQLLATWVAHDCDHLMQLSRTIGRQYADEVGPWRAYLRVVSGQPG